MTRLGNSPGKVYPTKGLSGYDLAKSYTGPVNVVHPRVAIGGARGAGVNPAYLRSGGPQGALMDTIQSMEIEPVKSALQIANEYENNNPVINPVGTIMTNLFGKDWVARGAGNAAYAVDKYANTSPNKNPDNMKKQVTGMASGKVTPMDVANVAAFVPGLGEAAGLGVNGLLKAGEAIVPKSAQFEPIAQLVGGSTTTRIPGGDELASILERYTGAGRTAPSTITASPHILKTSSSDIWGMSNDENYTGGGTRPKARRQASKVNDRFRNAETGERAKASQKDVVEWAKQVTDNNPNFWAKEENDPNRWHLGHDLLNPYKKGKGSLTPTHYVDKYLNEIAEKLMSSGKVQKSALKDGEDYTPILKYILENPSDPVVAPIYKNRPEIIGSTLPDAAEKLGANHLMRFA